MNWRDFWNGEHSIYVNDRHRLLHYDRIARDILGFVDAPDAVVLDHGCGEASAADAVAGHVGRLCLYDVAPRVQEKLRLKFASNSRIEVLSSQGLEAVPDASLDLIIVNSLLQYLTRAELEHLLDFWHAKLKGNGKLVLADIIPPDVGPLTDVKALLAFAWQGGFFFAALGGLVATFFSDYRTLRGALGLTYYTALEITAIAAAHGFALERAARNVGHNQARMGFVGRRAEVQLFGCQFDQRLDKMLETR